MSLLEHLSADLGPDPLSLTGSNSLRFTPADPAIESAATGSLSTALRGTFVRLDCERSYQEAPQAGSLLVGKVDG